MVISFEENDRAVIEARGIMIIEFKRQLYNMKISMENAWKVLEEILERVKKAWNVFVEKFQEVVDSVKLIVEQIKEVFHCPVSLRYRIVKVFCKCTGIDIRFCWNTTWKIKRWLARSYC